MGDIYAGVYLTIAAGAAAATFPPADWPEKLYLGFVELSAIRIF